MQLGKKIDALVSKVFVNSLFAVRIPELLRFLPNHP
jgi:hypothetical protein